MILRRLLPAYFAATLPGHFAVTGAAAVACAATRTMSTAVVTIELTGQLSLQVPVLVATTTAYLVAALLETPSLFDAFVAIKKLPGATEKGMLLAPDGPLAHSSLPLASVERDLERARIHRTIRRGSSSPSSTPTRPGGSSPASPSSPSSPPRRTRSSSAASASRRSQRSQTTRRRRRRRRRRGRRREGADEAADPRGGAEAALLLVAGRPHRPADDAAWLGGDAADVGGDAARVRLGFPRRRPPARRRRSWAPG